MSVILERLLAQAVDEVSRTVTLSPESVAVLLYATSFLDTRKNWLDTGEDPLDEITAGDWDEIEKLRANLIYEVFHAMIGFIFPLMVDLPENCLLCDGTTYNREDYPALYGALDAAFIIDADTFFVPDLRSHVVIGAGGAPGFTDYPVADSGGVESVTLSSGEMPTHTHGLFQSTSLAVAPGELPVVIPFLAEAGSTGATGSGGAHENRQPFVALNFAVVAL